MLTPERIEEIAEGFIEETGSSGSVIYSGDIVDFAHALLAEVKLEDILREERGFIEANKDKLAGYFNCEHFEFYYVNFGSCGLVVDDEDQNLLFECLWDDYYQWKQQLTEQTQEVKK